MAQPAALERSIDRVFSLGTRHVLQLCDVIEIASHRHLGVNRRGFGQVAHGSASGQRIAENVVPRDRSAAFRGRNEAGEDPHGRGLTRAVRPEEPHHLAGAHRERDIVQGEQVTVPLDEAPCFDLRRLLIGTASAARSWLFCHCDCSFGVPESNRSGVPEPNRSELRVIRRRGPVG